LQNRDPGMISAAQFEQRFTFEIILCSFETL